MNAYEKKSDEQLIAGYRGGDTCALDYLMNKYKGLVMQKARSMFLLDGDHDDLIQEGMIGLFKAIRDYKPEREASFLTFAHLCIQRQIYSAVQNSNRKKNSPLNEYVTLSEEDDALLRQKKLWVESPESIVLKKEAATDLETVVRKVLSPLENEVFTWYLKGENYVRISQRLQKTPKQIDNALQRIRKKIKASQLVKKQP